MSSAYRLPRTPRYRGKAQIYVDGYFARPTIDTALFPSTVPGARSSALALQERPVDRATRRRPQTTTGPAQRPVLESSEKIVDKTYRASFLLRAHVNGCASEVEGFKSPPVQSLELKEVSPQALTIQRLRPCRRYLACPSTAARRAPALEATVCLQSRSPRRRWAREETMADYVLRRLFLIVLVLVAVSLFVSPSPRFLPASVAHLDSATLRAARTSQGPRNQARP